MTERFISKSVAAMTAVTVIFSSVTTAVDPAHALNLTVFHINPIEYGPIPVNMDTGDAAGDLFFDMLEVISYPIDCPEGPATPSHHGHSTCSNKEAYGSLQVNKLIIEVDDRFSEYAKCNIGVNGTDGHGNACKDGTYCCYCSDGPCDKMVGFENVTSQFNRYVGGCEPGMSKGECYRIHSVKKFGGNISGAWYSTLQEGCADPLHPTDDCTWRIVSEPVSIHRECHTQKFFDAIARYNQSCFGGCASGNFSDSCHATCFYETALGPNASTTGDVHPDSGVPTNELVQAWQSGFNSPKDGGCPRI